MKFFPLFRFLRSNMQSCFYKRLFSYSVSKYTSIRVLHQVNNKCTNDEKLPDTLNHRFIKYLEEAVSVNKPSAAHQIKTIKNSSLINTRASSVADISSLVDQIQDLRGLNDPIEIRSLLNIVDEKICRQMNELSFNELLLLLNKLIEIVPQKLAGLNAFPEGIEKLRNMLNTEFVKSSEVVNLLFLASLTKTAAAKDISLILKHLPSLGELSLIEKSIVSMATFKAGVKLGRRNIQVIEDTVHENLDLLISEPGLFVSLLKALRFAGPSPEFSLTPISKQLLESKSSYKISTAVPILALYAEMLKLEKKVVRRLVSDSILEISRFVTATRTDQESKDLNFVRTKDVDRLLWATSRLNHRMSKDQLAKIDKFVESRLDILSNDPRVFARMLLSLWMLRSSRCRENVEYCFKERVLEPLLNAPQEDQARLDLLLECVRVEAPGIEIPSVFQTEKSQKFIKPCKELETISELIKCLGPSLALYDTEIDCPAKAIRIYGITARHESLGWIHIDTLNKVTCLKDTRKPNGMMSLKLRLVKAMGYFSILLENNEVINVESMISKIEESINAKLRN